MSKPQAELPENSELAEEWEQWEQSHETTSEATRQALEKALLAEDDRVRILLTAVLSITLVIVIGQVLVVYGAAVAAMAAGGGVVAYLAGFIAPDLERMVAWGR
jgi:hypothetical protein